MLPVSGLLDEQLPNRSRLVTYITRKQEAVTRVQRDVSLNVVMFPARLILTILTSSGEHPKSIQRAVALPVKFVSSPNLLLSSSL